MLLRTAVIVSGILAFAALANIWHLSPAEVRGAPLPAQSSFVYAPVVASQGYLVPTPTATIQPQRPVTSPPATLPACYIPGVNACNCSDFSTQYDAQAFHDWIDPTDINRLDGDGDGYVCENLPAASATPTRTSTSTPVPPSPTTFVPSATPTQPPTAPTATGTPVAQVSIVGVTTAFTPTGSTFPRIVGEVINNGSGTVELIQVVANLFDSNNTFVGTDFTFTVLDKLKPSDKTCFSVLIVSPPAGWNSHQFEPVTALGTTAPIDGLTLGAVNGDTSSGFYRVQGMITNNTGQTMEFVKAVVTTYNVDGQVNGCGFGFTSADTLAAGQSSSFTALVTVPDPAQVATYRVQVEGRQPQ